MSLLEELTEQPSVLDRVARENGAAVFDVVSALAADHFSYVVIAARGTSDNAARYAKYLWGARNHISVALSAPALYGAYQEPPNLSGALVVGISQSGASPDLVAVLEEAKRQGRPTLAITNQPSSPMAEVADLVIDLGAGEERAVAATKTYTAQLLAIAMLSEALRSDEESEPLRGLGRAAQFMIDQASEIEAIAGAFSHADHCATLGRGFNHSTAFEWALKLQELANVLAHPYSTADFQHGPIALVEPGFPLLTVLPGGPLHAEIHQLLATLQADRDSQLLVISDHAETLKVASHSIPLPEGLPEWLTPIPAIIGAQLFTYHLTIARGHDPDVPRGLQKVTRTR